MFLPTMSMSNRCSSRRSRFRRPGTHRGDCLARRTLTAASQRATSAFVLAAEQRIDLPRRLRRAEATGKVGEIIEVELEDDTTETLLTLGLGDDSPADARKAGQHSRGASRTRRSSSAMSRRRCRTRA